MYTIVCECVRSVSNENYVHDVFSAMRSVCLLLSIAPRLCLVDSWCLRSIVHQSPARSVCRRTVSIELGLAHEGTATMSQYPNQRIMFIPTLCGNVPTVDSKGRIVLPQDVRERLGITPGTEVVVHEEDGKAVVKPEDCPEEILERMEQLIADASLNRGETTPLSDGADPIAEKHRDAVRRGAENHCDE